MSDLQRTRATENNKSKWTQLIIYNLHISKWKLINQSTNLLDEYQYDHWALTMYDVPNIN